MQNEKIKVFFFSKKNWKNEYLRLKVSLKQSIQILVEFQNNLNLDYCMELIDCI